MCHSGTWHILHVLGSSHFQEFSCRQMAGHHSEPLSHQSAAVLTSCLTKHALFFSHQCQLMVPAGSRVEYAILSLQVATSETETSTTWHEKGPLPQNGQLGWHRPPRYMLEMTPQSGLTQVQSWPVGLTQGFAQSETPQ